MLVSSLTPPATSEFRIDFDGAPASVHPGVVRVLTPWLAGEPGEALFPPAIELPAVQGVRLFRCGDAVLGHAGETTGHDDLAIRSEALYRRVLAACGGRHLYRVWNYVPRINAANATGDSYRAFCIGRARAFEQILGPRFESHLPAASAVGCAGDRLEAVFVAGSAGPAHVENPEQVPAYRYPIEHGPRSPSFARATIARLDDRRVVFVSGTSAIKGHRTVAPGTLEAQIDCTLDNLRLISLAVQLGENLGAGVSLRRHFKIYLRHADDLNPARTRLELSLLKPGDTVTYLQAEICRAALNIEIEATLFG